MTDPEYTHTHTTNIYHKINITQSNGHFNTSVPIKGIMGERKTSNEKRFRGEKPI